MPKCHTVWTVLPHKPLEQLAENLWVVKGTLGKKGPDRKMTIARLMDGGLVIHNAMALDEPSMTELERLGPLKLLVVPGEYHRLDARLYKERYPSLVVTCPAAARKKVEQVVAVDVPYEEAPSDESVRFSYFEGVKRVEGFVEVSSADGVTYVVNDIIANRNKLGGPMGFVLGPTGQAAVPRLVKWVWVRDRRALRSHLERLAEPRNLCRLIVAHGKTAAGPDAARALREAAAML